VWAPVTGSLVTLIELTGVKVGAAIGIVSLSIISSAESKKPRPEQKPERGYCFLFNSV
tara:strand:- start:363 stop:536 length:174 start_codon:yes stop_codon:yes gene_type:complete